RRGVAAAMQLAARGYVAQRVNVRAQMAAQGQPFRGGAGAVGHNVLAVHLGEAEEKRGMHGMVRHADKIGLAEAIDPGRAELLDERVSCSFHTSFQKETTPLSFCHPERKCESRFAGRARSGRIYVSGFFFTSRNQPAARSSQVGFMPTIN